MSEQKKGKKSKKRGLIIFSSLAIIVFMIVGITISSQISEQASTTTGTSIDLAFDNWVISGEGYNRYIEDMGDYIEIYDYRYGSYIQARLDFESITKGSFKTQVRTPDLSKDGGFQYLLCSGDEWVLKIQRYRRSGVWYFQMRGDSLLYLLFTEDTSWHSIEILFEIDGDNSEVSINVDGNTIINSMNFNTAQLIDNIRYTTSSIHIPTLTHIKLESLIKSN